MKKWFLGIVASVALFSLAACGSGDTVIESDAGDITKDELYEEMKSLYGDTVIQQLVEKKLLENKYDVSNDEIEEEFEKVKEQFGSDEEFEMALMQNGFQSADQLKEEIRFNLLRQKAVTDGIEVTDEKLQEFYDENPDMFVEVEARHILVEDEDKANEVIEKLNNGENFEDLVTEYSTDTGSVAEGGSVGTVTTDSPLVPEFIDAALKLNEGEVSDPVESTYGFHIIKADSRTEMSFDDNRDEIEEKYLQQNARPYEEVREELFREANIKVIDDQFEELFQFDDVEDTEDDAEEPELAEDEQANEETNEEANEEESEE